MAIVKITYAAREAIRQQARNQELLPPIKFEPDGVLIELTDETISRLRERFPGHSVSDAILRLLGGPTV